MHTFRIFFRDHAKLPTLGLEPQEGPKCWKGPKKSWFCLPSHLSLLTCSLVISFSIFEKKTTYCLWKIIKRPKRSWIWAKPFFFWKILRKTKRGGGWLCVSRLGCLSLRKVGLRVHNNIRSNAVLPRHEVGFFLFGCMVDQQKNRNWTDWLEYESTTSQGLEIQKNSRLSSHHIHHDQHFESLFWNKRLFSVHTLRQPKLGIFRPPLVRILGP